MKKLLSVCRTLTVFVGLSLLFTQQVFSQAALVPNAQQQFFDANGNPLSNGKVYMTVPNTTTPKTTWKDSAQTENNTNPINLDAGGWATIYGQGNYNQRVVKSNGDQVWSKPTSAYGSSAPSGATGTDTAPVGSVMAWSGFVEPVNWQFAYGQEVSRVTYSDLLDAITSSHTSVTCINGSPTLGGWPDTSQFVIGAAVEATCIPTGSVIVAIPSSTSITLNNNAAASSTVTARVFPWGNGNGTSTFNVPDLRGRLAVGADAMGGTYAARLTTATTITTTSASPTATVASASGLSVGMVIVSANVPVGATITNIVGTTITMSLNASASASGTAVRFFAFRGVAGLGGAGGSKNVALVNSNNPPYTPAGTIAVTADNNVGAADGGPLSSSAGSPNAVPWRSAAGSPPSTVSAVFTGTPQGGTSVPVLTVQPAISVNYIIKVKPNSTGAGGVVSIGGMFGDILCGGGIDCSNQTISVVGFPTGVISFNSRTGVVTPQTGDYDFSQISGMVGAGQLDPSTLVTSFNTRVGAVTPQAGDYNFNQLSGTISSAQIATDAVTTAKILDANVTTSKIANANVTAAKLAAGAASTNIGMIAVKDYTAGGTSNDTTGVQSAFTACNSAGGCILVCENRVVYTVDTITVGSNTTLVGQCVFKQRTSSNSILSISGKSNVIINGVNFIATSPTVNTVALIQISSSSVIRIINSYFTGSATVDTGLSTPTGGANAIQTESVSSVTQSNDIRVSGNFFYRFNFVPVRIYATNNFVIADNTFQSNAFGVYITGSKIFTVANNIFDTTVLYATSPSTSQFAIAIALDSTDGHSLGVSTRGTITNNVIRRYGYSQGILVHAGSFITIGQNSCEETGICVSINPASSGGASDVISNVTIVGNQSNGATGLSSFPSSADIGIVVQSGPAPNVNINNVTVTGNVITGHNRVALDSGAGCMSLGYADYVTVSGNVFGGCGGSGIVVNSPVVGAIISTNNINNMVSAGGNINGIYYVTAASSAQVNQIGNHFKDLTNGTLFATGISVANIQLANSLCISVTNCTSGP